MQFAAPERHGANLCESRPTAIRSDPAAPQMMRILILGGSGVFGRRLAAILSRDARFELIVAGRDGERAQQAASDLPGPAAKRGAAVSIDTIDAALTQMAPDVVIHCAGPFQGQDYTVAKAAIAAGVHYLDLSDGRAFSEGFTALNDAARKAGVFALTACSTTTALSTAAAKNLGVGLARVDRIRVGVTPGNRAPRGRAVVAAILSYVGEPVSVLRNGAVAETTGWGRLRRETLPGLKPRWFSPCDAPDIAAMRALFQDSCEIEFEAGLELSILHLPLWALAQLRRRRLIGNLAAAAGLFHRAASWFEPFGGDEGGMFVELEGADAAGKARTRRWSLWAGAGDGPNIPAMAATAVVKMAADGEAPAPGARMVVGDIALAAFEREFSAFDIRTVIEERP